MHVFTTVANLDRYLKAFREASLKVGCVPTMGALHRGHMALMRTSQSECQVTVATIFVNPTQFNDPSDLQKYPRPLQRDISMLEAEGVDVLFLPARAEVYPADFQAVEVDLGGLDEPMEGKHRPGHFRGVVTVVHRLITIVRPDCLYMGLKDFQQQAIIAKMIQELNLSVLLRPCPIVREEDGLAFSSRNVRLDPAARAIAPQLYRSLVAVKSEFGQVPLVELREKAFSRLEHLGFEVEYLEFVDADSMASVEEDEPGKSIVACVAAWIGGVRLIDNLAIRSQA